MLVALARVVGQVPQPGQLQQPPQTVVPKAAGPAQASQLPVPALLRGVGTALPGPHMAPKAMLAQQAAADADNVDTKPAKKRPQRRAKEEQAEIDFDVNMV